MPSSVTQGSKHYLIIYKEEPHTNNKRFTESAELNVCMDSAQLAVHVHKASP